MLITIGFPLQSRHRLRHRQGRDDGSPADSHTLRLRCGADGWQGRGKLCEIRTGYRKTHNLGNPSDRHGRRPSDNFRQRDGYGPQGADLLSAVLSEPIPWGTRGHRPYPDSRGREPGCTSSYSSWALAGSGSRKSLQSLRS